MGPRAISNNDRPLKSFTCVKIFLFQLIGSSLLIMHDKHNKGNVWMIDFAKTLRVEGMTLNHRSPWVVGNHEDGYLQGLDNLYEVRHH